MAIGFCKSCRYVSLLMLWPLLYWHGVSSAAESVCAEVKLEIIQEAVIERQAFEATLRISNGMPHDDLEQIDIDVLFEDAEGNPVKASSNPNDEQASFFVRVSQTEGIANVTGGGRVAAGQSAEIKWLIIPAPGSALNQGDGTFYLVGARWTYKVADEDVEVDILPDSIYVKPLPNLQMDYFLPHDVYGDDPFTDEIEPSIPFNLGVRLKNTGADTAKGLQIDSGDAQIAQGGNEQGLLVDFAILGSSLDGESNGSSMVVEFGDIEPGQTSTARWTMITSLTGEFVAFDATVHHEDSLGGKMTAFLNSDTHLIVANVMDDRLGSDAIKDFLARDGFQLKFFGSDGLDGNVSDHSSAATLQAVGPGQFDLTLPESESFVYVQLPDPGNGKTQIDEVWRSDGKRLNHNNVWISQKRKEDKSWEYFINLFDTDSTGKYRLGASSANRPPLIQAPFQVQTYVGGRVRIRVKANDPDGGLPQFAEPVLPQGAQFVQKAGNSGLLTWSPRPGQEGENTIELVATDGSLTALHELVVVVNPADDIDGDGMADHWELAHFGTLDRDGAGDYDNDGISDLREYQLLTDPTIAPVPAIPVIAGPQDGATVTELQPTLEVHNSDYRGKEDLHYAFDLFEDDQLTQRLEGTSSLQEGSSLTAWEVSQDLQDNRWYYWRVRAYEAGLSSQWNHGRFFVNQANDAPSAPVLDSPLDTEICTLAPTLRVLNATDVDGDPLEYRFEVYSDAGLINQVLVSGLREEGDDGTTQWTPDQDLQDNSTYYWVSRAADPEGLETQSAIGQFKVNTANDAPTAPSIALPLREARVYSQNVQLVAGNAVDQDGDTLTYHFEVDVNDSFSSDRHQSQSAVPEGNGSTRVIFAGLDDNTRWNWRVKAADGQAESGWAQGSFVINTANDPPGQPVIKNPADGAWVESAAPTLSVLPVTDPDGDEVLYRYQVYADQDLTTSVLNIGGAPKDYDLVHETLSDNTWYYWRARAEDRWGEPGPWTDVQRFFINDNGLNDPPTLTFLSPLDPLTVTADTARVAWEHDDPDSNASVSIYYDTDRSGADGTAILLDQSEDYSDYTHGLAWHLEELDVGTYYIYGVISDEESAVVVYAPGSVTVSRERAAAITVEPTYARMMYESSAATRAVVVALDKAPTAEVRIPVSSSDETEISVSTHELLFTPGNWDQEQIITVSGVNDCLIDGDQNVEVLLGLASSQDPAYQGKDPADVPFVTRDDDNFDPNSPLQICRYEQTGVLRVSRSRSQRFLRDLVFRVEMINHGDAATNVIATASTHVDGISLPDNEVSLGDVASGEEALSSDTFTVRMDVRYPFALSDLQWTVESRQ